MGEKRNGSHLVLMELMLALFFFAICGAILLEVFVKSYNISRKAKELTETKNYVTQAAELFESGCTTIDEYQKYFPKLEESQDQYQGYFDKNWNMTSKKNAVYQMTIRLEDKGKSVEGKIRMLKEKKTIYYLDLFSHFPERKSNEKS